MEEPVQLFEQGFTNLDTELLDLELSVEGYIPPWLGGTLLRNGPARFDLEKGRVGHWFDGLAMLHAFAFTNGRVTYSNRYLHTRTYRTAQASGSIGFSAFTADPCKSLFSRIFTMLLPYSMDNANVGIAHIAGRFLAMTETPMAIEFDPHTLRTIGALSLRDNVSGSLTTAHPLADPRTGLLYNYITGFGLPCSYKVYTIDGRRHMVGSVPVAEPAYMHSFAMTDRYVVLGEFPFLLNPFGVFSKEVPLIGAFRWHPERGTRFLVIDKHTGDLVRTYETAATFGFHHVNAWDTEDGITLDVIVYPDPSVLDFLYLDAIKQAENFPTGELRRYYLPRRGGAVTYELLSSTYGLELPQINERRRCRRYRYVYGVGVSPAGDFLDQIVKIDTQRRDGHIWSEEGCYPGEPIFVPHPDSRAENEGLLLSIVLDSRSKASFLLVLDATTMEEIGRARVPHHIPFGFHGLYTGS